MEEKNVPQSNKIVDVQRLIIDHLYFPTINNDEPFVFGVSFDVNNKPLIGDGSRLDPVYIFMTTLRLLRNADTTTQGHIAIFHIDGTCKTNTSNFPLISLVRSDINRLYYLICLGLLSKEETIDYVKFFEAFNLFAQIFK